MNDKKYHRESPWKEFSSAPDPSHWDDWEEYDAEKWPEKVKKRYRLIPTLCFNCESGCGLLAYVNKDTGQINKFEGNPVHPGSRGRTCAKGPATINQIQDPERILTPLKRVGPRGSGKFEPVSWQEVLDDLGGRIRRAIQENRHEELMYHVGRPGDDHFIARMLNAWGIDGHNSHTNVCSASARLGYSLWFGADRPSPDYSTAKFALLLSAHLETGHYFNPHAQRIMEAKHDGMKIAVVDTRLSNTSTHADYWVSSWPGTESALLLGIALQLLISDRIDKEFLLTWLNWEEFLKARHPNDPQTFDHFLEVLKTTYQKYTPEFVESECKIPAGTINTLADEIAAAGSQFTSHLWRNAASGHLGGWQVARCLLFLHALTGSIGTPGGVNPNSWDKFVPVPSENPPPHDQWSELLWPKEYPLAHFEMSFLLPHLLEDQNKKIDTYFSRVYNPVWTNPDGASWINMLEDENKISCHVALTPIWSETAQWADYVLPMGLGPERHDLLSQETHAGTWLGFRQPVTREFLRHEDDSTIESTLGTNPGEVWEEAEFWIALTWAIDPDGTLGIRKYYESKEVPGTKVDLDEYYSDIFENIPDLVKSAEKENITALEYMRRYGAWESPYKGQTRYNESVTEEKPGLPLADGSRKSGFETLTRKLEFYAPTLDEWGFGDEALPNYITSQVHWSRMNFDKGERALLPTFRLPTLIHTRSGNAKWLQEISHTNPLWVHPQDAEQLQITNGSLARVATEIGYFIIRAWVTEGIHPGVVACSHHVGRWRLHKDIGGEKLSSSLVDITKQGSTIFFRQKLGVQGFSSDDPDSSKIWWKETGVNQNLTFPVQPDPISGMHCWHQKVTVTPASPEDQYGDIFVDLNKSKEAYNQWLTLTTPAPGPGGLRRPLHMKRPLRPIDEAYYIK